MVVDKKVIEFDWNKGNIDKNKIHKVDDKEAEESFIDENKKIYKDVFHSKHEKRFILLGKSRNKNLLYVVFTKRNEKVRIISARKVSKKKEVEMYEKKA